MFRHLRETIKRLNVDVNNVVNCEKAKRLRRTLLFVGLPLAVVGFLGVFICFVLLVTAGFDAFDENGFSNRLLIPFILILPFAALGSIGTMLASFGFKIVVTGYTSDLIDETVGNRCVNCGSSFTSDMAYCPKCGKKLRKDCVFCGYVNNYKNAYCEKCGNKLE